MRKSKVMSVTHMVGFNTRIKNEINAYAPNILANLTIDDRIAGTKVFRGILCIILCHIM